MSDITNTEVFKELEAFIRTEEYTDIDLFSLIGDYAIPAPFVASAMAYHTRDILSEEGDEDRSYTDILVQVYWRTFFSPEHAGRYGTDQMVHSPELLANFAKYVIDPTSIEVAHVSSAQIIPPQRH